MRRRSWLLKLVLVGISTLVCLVGLELVLRVRDAQLGLGFFSGHRNVLAYPFRRMVPFRTFGFEPHRKEDGQRFIASVHGELYPLEKPPGGLRIACFGGSTTEDSLVADGELIHYPLLVERELERRLGRDDVEVINLGNSAYATPHALIMLMLEVISWQPDVVILSENVNDLSAAYWPDFRYDYSHKYSHSYYLPDCSDHASVVSALCQHSQVYWVLKDKLHAAFERFPPIERRPMGPEPPRVAAETYRRNLTSFVTLARSRGIAVVLGSQPLEPSEDFFCRHECYKPYNDVVVYPTHEEFLAHHRRYNQIIEEVARAEGVAFADGAAALAGETRYFIDYVHYSREGLERLAGNYVEVLMGLPAVAGASGDRAVPADGAP